MLKKHVKVQERKLGREKAHGQVWLEDNLMEIDPRQNSRQRLDTLVHEALHILFPNSSETKIIKSSRLITKLLWEQRYRRIMK